MGRAWKRVEKVLKDLIEMSERKSGDSQRVNGIGLLKNK
jgi:hypothetical protein